MMPTTWFSLPCAFARDAMTSWSRVRMVRADWAADEGGGGALVIASLLTDGCDPRQYPARDCAIYYDVSQRRRQWFPVGAAGTAANVPGVVPVVTVGPTGAGALMIDGGGAYLASHATASD